ncbi:xanthine phosphoribosyltransferase [Magnetospirillum sp. UT-4]|uniref:xanthine phosphoribosyltransferase n=1 Tax=Magnetospirillum sp. UT-4 TaxID=2681467 RepID=UPI001384594C|nr:xanthine phosphoribosyltransferase [Magnetospirillum sp. UT-4]CAA7616368.1 guanine-hypoxanthine phosphoribosyltransferase [Magnetospirillum sp. UT-4]
MSPDTRFAATLPLTWDDIHRDARALAARLRPLGPFSGLVAVARGGLVPAAILAGELDIRLVDTVCVASYRGRAQGDLEVLKGVTGDGAGWLVVDDLVDSGDTIRLVRAMLPRARIATLYAKPAGRALVDCFVAEFDQDVWVVFPWETDPAE